MNERFARVLVVLAVVAALGWVVNVFSFLLAPIALAALMVYSLAPVVDALENRQLPRPLAVAICFGTLLLLMGVAGWFVWHTAPLEQQSVFEARLQSRLSAWEHAGRERFPGVDWKDVFDHVRGAIKDERRRWVETIPVVVQKILSSVGTFVLAAAIALFMLLDGASLHRRVISLVPNRYFETVLVLFHRVDRQIAGYLRGAASEAVIVSVIAAVLLKLAGMPSAVLFGLLFGVVNVIPLVGPLIGASAGLLYSLMDPNAPAIPILLLIYASVHILDIGLVAPWVVGKSLDLHPLMIILALTAGGTLGGILGMLVAIPLVAVAKAIFGTLRETYRTL